MSCDYTIESTISNLMEKGIADLATMNLESASDLMIIATCAFIVVFIAADIIMKLINVASLAAMLVITPCGRKSWGRFRITWLVISRSSPGA